MTRFLKTCLIWLLMLALPAQAVAAAAGSSCASRHQAMPAPAWHEQSAADHQDPQSAHHIASADKPGHNKHKHKSGACSACAACCVGAAVISTIPDWTPATGNSFIAVVSPAPAFTAYIPAGPERPPRSAIL